MVPVLNIFNVADRFWHWGWDWLICNDYFSFDQNSNALWMRLIYLFCVLALDWFDWLIYFICVPSRLTKRIYPGTRRRKIQFCVSNSFIWDCFDWLIDLFVLRASPVEPILWFYSWWDWFDWLICLFCVLALDCFDWWICCCFFRQPGGWRGYVWWHGEGEQELAQPGPHRQGYQQHQVEQQGK